MLKEHFSQHSMMVISRDSSRTKWRMLLGLIVLLAVFGRVFLAAPTQQAHAATNSAVQYADAYWNCANISCSSKVSAGSAQPNFQCAEFVARALSTEGLVPGLNSNSSQSAYQNYHASNGQTYNLLWVGWTTASGYNTTKGLYQYLTQTGLGSDIGNAPSSAAPGDVTIYHEGDGHTALLVQTGSNALVDAHNNARYHVGYTEGYDVTIIHINATGTPPPSSSWPNVSQGSTGENVYSIQLMLEAHGYSLSVDGNFGSQTASTVEAFQSAHGLGVDGQVGPQTWPVLIVQTSQGSTGSAVEALQRQLNAHGESIGVDGDFGSDTYNAVIDFQTRQGLGVDGMAGPQTWQSLVS